MDVQPTMFFGNKQVATLSEGKTEFGHLFGGDALTVNGIRIHRLFSVNLEDPSIPDLPELSGTVPLYYCFDFRENVIGYFPEEPQRMFFDDEDPHKSQREEFPTDNYPQQFPEQPMAVSPYPYDPTDPDDALKFAGVFGLDDLSPENRKNVMASVREGYEIVMDEPPQSENDLIDFLPNPLLQGCPSWHCLNPDCPSYRSRESLMPFCMVPNRPVQGLILWDSEYSEVQVIFEVCQSCGVIVVSNQCT